MARGKSAEGEIIQAALVREALGALGGSAKPAAIDEYIREKHNRVVPRPIISSYKSMEKNKRNKGGGAKRGRKAAAGSGGIMLEDLAAVRGLVSRLGAAQVKQLVDVLE